MTFFMRDTFQQSRFLQCPRILCSDDLLNIINSKLVLPYVILIDEYYDSPGVMLRAQPFDYSIKVFSLGVSQDFLADCDTDVVLRRKGNETGYALKIEFQPQINCSSVRREIEFQR